MIRALLLATLVFVIPRAASGQAVGVLHIKVALLDAEGKAAPVPRHALLVSDNPTSAPPRRVVTALDGTADVSLRPGNYTVESERAVAFQGGAYQWTQTVDVVAGRGAILELTADNADVEPVTPAASTSAAPSEADPSALLMQWQDSVVALWTPTTHASGFVIDAKGLIATNQRVVGTAASIEVQLTPTIKVAASVLVSDPVRDVAILRIDPAAVASVRPVPLDCTLSAKPSLLLDGQEIVTIGAPFHGQKSLTSGTVRRVEPRAVVSDFMLPDGSTGGPVFTARGALVGITSLVDDKDEGRSGYSRIARLDDGCGIVASAEKKRKDGASPGGAQLPVEPVRPFPVDALKDAAQHRAGSLSPYQMSSSDFDIAFMTPVQVYGAQYQSEHASGRERSAEQPFVRPLMDFRNWSDYVADLPPVLLVRMTPKLVEGFWTTVARGAARTQGVSLPPIRHFKSGFSRMRAFCGDAEVTPIHPFKLEQRVSESDAIYEGLYVFDPAAFGPQCRTVKLLLYSDKEPEKGDTRAVDPNVIQQIWQDFAPYRSLN
jgi:hypothetical protein